MELPIKNILEEKAELRIRKGFDKLIPQAISYFNFKTIEKEEAIKIINLINKSNSALSESYWILRKEMSKEEYFPLWKKYCENWVKSSYKNTNRSSVSKKFIGINKSRGYSGWVEVKDKKFYCRSQFEFICINYLHEIYNENYSIEYEHSIFHLSKSKSYKPDYFIFKNNVLIKIIEVKSDVSFLKTNECKELENYFKKNKIDFEVFYDVRQILKNFPLIKEKLIIWKESASIEKDMRGKNNPRYGIKLSESGKKVVSEKAKERFSDKNYIKKISDRVKLTSVLNYIKETSCPFEYKTVINKEDALFYYITDEENKIIYPRGFYKLKNIKKLLNENN